MTEFSIGQKWISHAEPELAMGRVTHVEFRTISIYFDIANETRTYASKQAPLTRVRFKVGDSVTTNQQQRLNITGVTEAANLIVYKGLLDDDGFESELNETELDPNVRFSKPEDRLFTHQFDDNQWYNLRYETWTHTARLASSLSRGLYGPRVSLIPHQLYIANEVANRYAPRVLLADEVGLGKTIEAGMIMHQQLQTGRAQRILVIVPPALTFQWFVEMIRRFNLHFTVLDESRCQLIAADNKDADDDTDESESVSTFNPFDGQQLMLCSLSLFTDNPERLEQVLNTNWDLVVVDEAHHLHWSPETASLEYKVVELISGIAKGVLLLTATPEQLGQTGHFARLKLLDPNRFYDYEKFVSEDKQFKKIADTATALLQGSDDEKMHARENIQALIDTHSDSSPDLNPDLKESADKDTDLINALLDRHGTGRILFRNVRQSIQGFPKRKPLPYPLLMPDAYEGIKSNSPEQEVGNWAHVDPRIDWLIKLLLASPTDKFLLICAHQATALALEQRLGDLVTIRTTLFHEGMDLVSRDRSANYFAETTTGAQLMICSEIGSEGRNFQFASDLILFDLPLSPDLLEQRIGRLDRIGQKRDVTIHIPYFVATGSEYLYRLFHEGLSVFSQPNPSAQSIFDQIKEELNGIIFSTGDSQAIDTLIRDTKLLNQTRQANLHDGRDKLLELNSHRTEISDLIVEDILNNERGTTLEYYMEQSFDTFGLESEYSGNQILTIKPTESMVRNDSISLETLDHYRYPELPEDGIRITYNRTTALSVEDVNFLTWESPIVQQAMDAVITDVSGNSTMIAIKHPQLKAGTLLVEVLHIIDCVAPSYLMADRYMPPNIIRSVITSNLEDKADVFKHQALINEAIDVPKATLSKILDSKLSGIKSMLDESKVSATKALVIQKREALEKVNNALNQELIRLRELSKVNRNIRAEEIEHLTQNLSALEDAINKADIRMDAVRVIVAA